MIVLDIETSGIDKNLCGIWQIGALELEHPENIFFMEGRIDDDEIVIPSSLAIIGKTEEQLRDKTKRTQKELLEAFFAWTTTIKQKNLITQNPQFDYSFIEVKAAKHGIAQPNDVGNYPLPFRCFDLHSIAQLVYQRKTGYFLTHKEKQYSMMNLGEILTFCGLEDPRMKIFKGKTIKEGKPHDAYTDAELTAEAFTRLVYGKNLLPTYASAPVPTYLQHKTL